MDKNKLKCDGLIFDMDGTIWDNTPVFAPAWTRAAKEMGFNVVFTEEVLKTQFGHTMQEIADATIPSPDSEIRYRTLELCEKYEMEDLYASAVDTCYEGLVETIKELSKRINLYIVSNCQSGYIESFIEKANVSAYITDCLCYGDNGFGKADNLKLLCQKNNIKYPTYVGDIQSDLDACNKAGVPFVWASYGYGTSVESFVAKIIKPADLLEIF